jgi:hypothetical protein
VKKTLSFSLGAICILLFFSSVATAQDKYVTVGPCEFVSELHMEKQIRVWNWGVNMFQETTATHPWYYARVDLPDGAIIKWMKVHYVDNASGPYMKVYLRRANKYNGISDVIYGVSASAVNPAILTSTDLTPGNPAWTLVNLNVFNYYIMMKFEDGNGGGDVRLYGVTIGYQ